MFEHGCLAINGVSADTYIKRALPSHFGTGANRQQTRGLPGRRTPAATKSRTAAVISADHGVFDQSHGAAVGSRHTHIQAPREDTVQARPRGSPGYSCAALTAVATGGRMRADGCSGRRSPVTPPSGDFPAAAVTSISSSVEHGQRPGAASAVALCLCAASAAADTRPESRRHPDRPPAPHRDRRPAV